MTTQNTFRNAKKNETQDLKQSKKPDFLGFSFNDNSALKLLPYLVYIAFFGVVYIANRHYTERNIRKVSKLRKEVEALRINHTTLKSLYMNDTKYSEVLKKARKLRLSEGKDPHIKIKKNE